MRTFGWVSLALLVGAAASDAGSAGTGPAGGAVITIQNLTFSPANLEVAPGATVTVRNLDKMPHTVTSQAKAGSFTPGAVSGVSFDTGNFTGEKTFTIPPTAPAGTVIPYFCRVHKGGMKNSGTVTVVGGSGSGLVR